MWVIPVLVAAAIIVIILVIFEIFVLAKAINKNPSRRHLFLGKCSLFRHKVRILKQFFGFFMYFIQHCITEHAILSVSCQVRSNFGTCTVVGLHGTLVDAKMFTFTLECTHFIFNNCPIKPTTTVQMLNLATS